MRVEVKTSSYRKAAEALVSVNQSLATAYDTLTGKLSGLQAMGGDDASSQDFVAQYDPSAKELVAACADAVLAFATLAELTDASGENHHRANQESCTRSDPGDYQQCSSIPSEVTAFTPPTAYGGEANDAPDMWDKVVAHLEGWTWPSADTTKLRAAATAWKAMASSLRGISGRTSVADTLLSQQKSPEIPKAREALSELDAQMMELATELDAIGDSCNEYAQKVDTTKETVRGLMKDLATEVGLALGAAGISAFFTGPVGPGVTALIVGSRAVRYAHKIIAAFKAIKAIQGILRLATTLSKARAVRAVLRRYRSAKALRNKPRGKLPPKGKPNSYGYDGNGNRLPYANSRPTLPASVVKKVWDRMRKNPDGSVTVMDKGNNPVKVFWKPGQTRRDVWDMGHKPGKEYRRLRDDYLSGKIDKEEFLRRYRDPNHYRVEHPGRNRSHVDEKK